MSIPRNLGNFADNVNANGKVEVTGINATGTPSASTVLYGNGTWAAAGGGSSQWTTSGSDIYYNTGNVGIGTATPDALLHVYRASGKVATFGNNVNNNGTYAVIAGSVSNKNWVISNNMIAGGEFGIGLTSVAGGTTIGSSHSFSILQNETIKTVSTISVGNATPSTSGAGITFPATQSASTNANTLDDYEEGTWTPTDASGAGLTFTTYGSCKYTKVGRLVQIQAYIEFPSTTNTTLAQIGGLPFAGGYSFFPAVRPAINAGSITSLFVIMPDNGSYNTLKLYQEITSNQYTNANMSGAGFNFVLCYASP